MRRPTRSPRPLRTAGRQRAAPVPCSAGRLNQYRPLRESPLCGGSGARVPMPGTKFCNGTRIRAIMPQRQRAVRRLADDKSVPLSTHALAVWLAPLLVSSTAGKASTAAPASSVELLVAVLLGIGIPTAFVRPASLDDRSLWPFGERWRHGWAMAYIGVICVLVGFAVQALTSTRAFEQPDQDLQKGLVVGAILLTFVGVFVHVVPLLQPVPPGVRRWLTVLLAILLAKFGLDAGKAYARYWFEGAEGQVEQAANLVITVVLPAVAWSYSKWLVGPSGNVGPSSGTADGSPAMPSKERSRRSLKRSPDPP
jgi:hypothetical protein